jgi:hypothetical protein
MGRNAKPDDSQSSDSSEFAKQFIAGMKSAVMAREKRHRDSAKRVFDAVQNHVSEMDEFSSRIGVEKQIITQKTPKGNELDASLKSMLDRNSIGYFIEMILKNEESSRQTVRALKRHSKSRADKQLVFAWCEENIHRFGSMDDAAMDIAETFVPQKFRTVRDWMTEWKKLRSASTP